MTDNEMSELNAVFEAGYVITEKLINDGYCTKDGCVGTCSCVNDIKFVRAMDFMYAKKKPTQDYINTIVPEGFKGKLVIYKHEDDIDSYYNDVFCIEVSKE